MKNKLLKKITATALSLSLVFGMVSVVPAAHAANGANVAANITWDYFSLLPAQATSGKTPAQIEAMLDEKHNGHTSKEDGSFKYPWCWYHALTHLRSDEFPDGQLPYSNFATQGWVVPGSSASSTQLYAANTGWDAEYDDSTGAMVNDNPWGLRFYTSDIPVEKGRTYTLSFKYTSDIKGKKPVYETDENGFPITDENGDKVVKKDEHGKDMSEDNFQKHIGLSVINPKNSNGLDLKNHSGYLIADAQKGEQTVTATFTVPANYSGTAVAVQLVAGAYLVSYPDENAMTGSLYIKDFKVTAGTQYSVTYKYGKQSYTQYVNPGGKASGHQFAVKGKTFKEYKKGSAKYNLSTPVNSNITLTCVYTNTPKPAKAKVKFKVQKRKVKLTLKKIKNCVGYEIKYANNKKMKKAKTKYTKKKTYTVRGLKSKKKTFFQIRGYNLDSAKKKVFSKKVLKKTVKVK